jgi:hypothetical protein
MSIRELIEKLINNPPRRVYHNILSKFAGAGILEFDQEHPSVFVLSTGRTGTETIAHLLNLSRDLFAYHEPSPSLYPLAKMAYGSQSRLNTHPDHQNLISEGLKAMRKELWDESLSCRKGYAETSPQVTFLAPYLNQLIPDSLFLHLIRHPMDVIRSSMRRGWYLNSPYDETRIEPLENSLFHKKWSKFSELEKNTWLWAETNKWISDFLKTIPKSQYLVLHSEDVFQRDHNSLKSIFNLLNVGIPPSSAINRVLSRKFNKQKSGEFQFPYNWLEKLDNELLEFFISVALQFDYDITETKDHS